MKPITNLRSLVPILILSLALGAQAQSKPEALPTAESILDRFIEATGGKAAHSSKKSEIVEATMKIAGMGVTGKMMRYSAPPDSMYSAVELGPAGKMESGVTSGVAWDKNAVMGARLKDGEERTQALRSARFNGVMEWRQVYSKAEVVGRETAEGEDCYKVVLTPKEGRPETQYYSVRTGLLRKTTTTAVSPMGEVQAEAVVLEYKQIDDILYPIRSREKAGSVSMDLNIMSVRWNEPIDPQLFQLPADIRALLPGAKAAQEK